MESQFDLDKFSDQFLINYYQDLMFNLAKESKDVQDMFLTAYYGMADSTQNKGINKVNLYVLLGFTAIKILAGINHSADSMVYLLGLNVAVYNFIAQKYNFSKTKANKNLMIKFLLDNLVDEYSEAAAFDSDDSKMERILLCMDKAFLNIVASNEHMIRIQNYRYMTKLKKVTNVPNADQKQIRDSLILLSRCILNIDTITSESLLYQKALSGDINSIIMFYLSDPQWNSQKIDKIVERFTLSDMESSYKIFMAAFLSGIYSIDQMQDIKHKIEFNNKRSLFLENNGKISDFCAMCECFYYDSLSKSKTLTIEEQWAFKKAKRYLKRCKTEIAFFHESYENSFKEGKKQLNGEAALTNFASRGLSYEIIEPEKISVKNIFEKEIQKN